MTRFLLATLALATIATPALAADVRALHFSRDGRDYVATVSERDGVQTIVGRELHSGKRFALKVANGRVRGAFDGTEVAYAVPAVDEAVQTAAR